MVHNNLAILLNQQGDVGNAIFHYQEAITLYPGFAKAHNNLGSALAEQKKFEEAAVTLIKKLHKKTGLRKLAIAGGCGLNCKSNGKILEKNIFDEIYVPPVPNDAGGSLGAAYLAYNKTYLKKPKKIQNAFLGYQIKDDLIIRCAKNFKLHIEKIPENTITKIAAKKISEGNIKIINLNRIK